MKLVWDEPKRISNLEKHGLDFADLTLAFFEGAYISAAKFGRRVAIGRMPDGTITVIFVHMGGEALSIISMRPASRRERALIE